MPPAHLTRRQAKKVASERSTAARQSKFTTIVQEQGGLCWFCGEPMGGDCTREHLLARALGGGDERENIRAAHSECNSAAGHLSVEDKLRLRAVAHDEGRAEMIVLARSMRRADARVGFGEGVVTRREDMVDGQKIVRKNRKGEVVTLRKESGILKISKRMPDGTLRITYS